MKPNQNTVVRLAEDEKLTFRDLEVPHVNPTGAQILEAANANGAESLLLQRLPSGDLESIRMSEAPDLGASKEFILSLGDRSYSMFIDEAQMVWAARHISGATLRKLGRVHESLDLVLERPGEEAQVIDADTVVDLGRPGVEKFFTRKKTWKLRVQSVTLDYDVPHVKVGDAMKRAGFDPTKAWDIFLLVAGQPKKKVDVNFDVDLTTPGIERIRLMQRNVDNGDAAAPEVRREFSLLPADHAHLDQLGFKWETVKCGERRWLIIHDFQPLQGYKPKRTKLALDIPKDYPRAQIDMFYFDPPVRRCDGVAIPSTQVTVNIDGVQYEGWSRHRNGACPWDPLTDNVVSHLVLVESAMAKEFGE